MQEQDDLGGTDLLAPARRVLHGPSAKRAFHRAMDWLGIVSPELSYSLRTGIRTVGFPLRPRMPHSSPVLRDDLDRYADLYDRATANFENTVRPYHSELQWSTGRVLNGFFESIDAELYYCMIRSLRPRRILEIGAGNSTWVARDALRVNGEGQLVAIDPDPRLALPRECRLVRRRIQDVEPSVFRDLRPRDVLFIDSSHTAEEAAHYVENVWPSLEPGVFVHVHDMVFPYKGYSSFSPDWTDLGEQEVVLDYLTRHRDAFEIFTSSAFVQYERPSLVSSLIPSKRHKPLVAGGSTWIRKVA